MWDLKTRIRDPFTREIPSHALTDMQFMLAARMQLGVGLEGIVENLQEGSKCNACNKAIDRCGFHLLYSCHSHQGHRNRRHAAVQRVYETLAKRANLSVSTDAPNVTPRANSNNLSHSGKQEFGDWSITDGGVRVVFDNSNVGTFTATARKFAANPRLQGDLPRTTHPATYAIATDRRKIKYDLKGPGCAQRDILFLPIINTSAGGFVPQDPVTLPVHTEAAERYFGSKLAGALGRVGTRPRSVEEGLIRRWSRRVADVPGGGKGVFDATLSTDRAAGLLTAYTYRAIAHVALRATANAAAHAIARSNIATFF